MLAPQSASISVQGKPIELFALFRCRIIAWKSGPGDGETFDGLSLFSAGLSL